MKKRRSSERNPKFRRKSIRVKTTMPKFLGVKETQKEHRPSSDFSKTNLMTFDDLDENKAREKRRASTRL